MKNALVLRVTVTSLNFPLSRHLATAIVKESVTSNIPIQRVAVDTVNIPIQRLTVTDQEQPEPRRRKRDRLTELIDKKIEQIPSYKIQGIVVFEAVCRTAGLHYYFAVDALLWFLAGKMPSKWYETVRLSIEM